MIVINISGPIGSGKTTIARDLSTLLRKKGCQTIKLEETINKHYVDSLLRSFYSTFDCTTNFKLQMHFVDDSNAKIEQLNKLYSEGFDGIVVLDTNVKWSQKAYAESCRLEDCLTDTQYTGLIHAIDRVNLNPNIICVDFNIKSEPSNVLLNRIRLRGKQELESYKIPESFNKFRNFLLTLCNITDEISYKNKCITLVNSDEVDKRDLHQFILRELTRKTKLVI